MSLVSDVHAALIVDLSERLRSIIDKDPNYWKRAGLRNFVLTLAQQTMVVMPDVPVEEEAREQIVELCRQARVIIAVTVTSIARTISPESFETVEVPDAATDPVSELPNAD